MKKEKVEDILAEMTERIQNAVSPTRDNWEGDESDELYRGFIYGFRFPGMGNSSQVFMGNKIALMTLFTSMMSTMIRRKVISIADFKSMINMIENTEREENESNR